MLGARLPPLPAKWRISRLKHVGSIRFSSVDKHSVDGEQPVRLCNYVDVYRNDRITKEMPLMRATATADEIRRFRVQAGDVLINERLRNLG